jgi:hypothetical protein
MKTWMEYMLSDVMKPKWHDNGGSRSSVRVIIREMARRGMRWRASGNKLMQV